MREDTNKAKKKRKIDEISSQILGKPEFAAASTLASQFSIPNTPKHDTNIFLKYVIDGNLRLVKAHISNNFNAINLKTQLGEDAFHLALKHNHWYVASYLLKQNKNFLYSVDINGNNAFLAACRTGNEHNLRYLLNKDKNLVYSVDKNGVNGFHIACEYGYMEMIDFFLKNDLIFLSVSDNCGKNAFLKAAKEGRIDVLKKLLEHDKYLISSIDNNQNNALKEAADGRRLDAVKFLLSLKPEFVYKPGVYTLQTTSKEVLDVVQSTKEKLKINTNSTNHSSSNATRALNSVNVQSPLALNNLSFNFSASAYSTELNADPNIQNSNPIAQLLHKCIAESEKSAGSSVNI